MENCVIKAIIKKISKGDWLCIVISFVAPLWLFICTILSCDKAIHLVVPPNSLIDRKERKDMRKVIAVAEDSFEKSRDLASH